MKVRFIKWISENKSGITKPDKYANTIVTISNHFKKRLVNDINLYNVTESNELIKLKDEYFSHREFHEKNLRGNRMYSRALDLYIEFLEVSSVKKGGVDTTLKAIIQSGNLTETEKQAIILSRIGQGKYRSSLIELWKSCTITQFDNASLLIASHIKPWKESTNEERIDKYNGLLLLPTYDRLFDLGYITFSDSGNIIISDYLDGFDKLGLSESMKIEVKEENKKYLDYHRTVVFKCDRK